MSCDLVRSGRLRRWTGPRLGLALLVLLLTFPATASWSASPVDIDDATSARARTVLASPLRGPLTVTRPFLAPAHEYGPGHRGVDLSAAPGVGVYAAAAGLVRHAGPVAGRPVVSLTHGDGLVTTYEPVTPVVREGVEVTRGELIGMVVEGHPGCSAPACLHFGVLVDLDYVDPLVALGRRGLRLLPWSGRRP